MANVAASARAAHIMSIKTADNKDIIINRKSSHITLKNKFKQEQLSVCALLFGLLVYQSWSMETYRTKAGHFAFVVLSWH